MSYTDALSAVREIYGVITKVKENREDLLRVSRRIEHIILFVEDSKRRDVIRADEYNDALTTISDLILRTQRITQRLLKRSLGDRTWNASEITAEIKRLGDDVQNYLSVHTIRALDIIQVSNSEQYTILSNNVEEIMVKLAELDLRLSTPPGDPWAQNIQTRARDNLSKAQSGSSEFSSPRSPMPSDPNSNISAEVALLYRQETSSSSTPNVTPDISLQALVASGKTSLRISGLKIHPDDPALPPVTFSNLKADAPYEDILKAIKDGGYSIPDNLLEQDPIPITITEDHSVYDATAPGGLQIASSEPLLWWWNKYTAYHGLAPATTPGQTIAKVNHHTREVSAGGVTFHFHRTLRVPDTAKSSDLPPSLGTFPLVPVSKYAHRLPEHVRSSGGFLMPMFKREALWISFKRKSVKAAVKLSVGGVNAISGIAKDIITPLHAEQDYIVAGLQPWIDGVATEPGVVRQFVATTLGEGYTVEEQVTGKAEIGGFQFDVFPRRPRVDGWFKSGQHSVDHIKTPAELSLNIGEKIHLYRHEYSYKRFGTKWTLAGYWQRVSPSAIINAFYRTERKLQSARLAFPGSIVSTEFHAGSLVGIAPGGKIDQRIYRDPESHRVYDEEHGHRFYVHIISPEAWEDITGLLPPFTPITRDMYVQQKLPWFTLYDNYMDHLTTASDALGKVQSVAQLDKQKQVGLPSSDPINPDDPPRCPRHRRSVSSCVFRPCGHLACEVCLGRALLDGSKCVECKAAIAKFVGMKRPIPLVARTSEDEEEGDETEWTVHEMEDLAAAAADTNGVSVIYFAQDRVPPLHPGPRNFGNHELRVTGGLFY